ncbi:crotonobetaine/carnitine-CoA ligase [Blastococcus colisei]|uniref:Crotonobetaine/carnitine-CoA ligase n=2 Tax=Blastococcus colisei TaxID=1564162 RepID=A0A543PG65_9ACTN|nr:crotonobetaine/carnitine-CoA ligase [Blastococcus colisei]
MDMTALSVDVVGRRNLRNLLTERVDRQPDKPYLVFEGRNGDVQEFTYSEFLRNVQRAAAGFAGLGIGKGDAVVIHLPNCPEFLFSWFGLTWIGAVAVPANAANTATEMEHVLGHSEAVAVVVSADHWEVIDRAVQGAPTVKHRVLARTTTAMGEAVLFTDFLAADAEPPVVEVDSEDVAQMIFTSGTTSRPKAVMLTHANCLRSGERASRSAAADDQDRFLTALPAFHVNAQSMTIMASLTVGGTCILLEEYRASIFWSQLIRHRATSVSLVAMQVRTLLAQPPRDEDRQHHLRRNFYAINVLDSEKEEFERRYGVELVNGYGLSEAMTIVTVAPVFGEKRWPSIGLPAYDRIVRIVDERGEDVPLGSPGEIIVWGIPGRTLMKGYFKDPDATAAALRDGWLYTGDNGYFDERGYVYFFDRKKDVIKRSGENISASEVEVALLTHEGVAEAAVIGVPDPIRDEAVKAFVVAREGVDLTVDEVLRHCREHLAGFKVPTVVEIIDGLPKTSIGKIEKKVLRQWSAESGAGS